MDILPVQESAAGQVLPLLSIVIPTRERCEFLASCVRSALACTDPEIEVVVSDNASSDNTRAVIAGIADPRLVYANPGTRVPMYDNFEFALSKTRGRYLMFLGDDDAVLPGGVKRLLDLLRKEKPEAVNWLLPGYVWPGAANGVDGLLTIKPMHMRGGQSIVDSREMLATLAQGSKASYRFGGAKIYHGCVARRVVTDVVARAGRYFYVPWPDVGASIANLFVTRKIVVLGYPCTIAGESRASNGWSQRFQETANTGPANPHTAFVQENLDRPGAADARIRPISALTFFTLAETLRRMGDCKLELDSGAWMPTLESELASVFEPARTEQADIIDSNLAAIGLPPLDRVWSRKGKYKRARIRPPIRNHMLLPNRMCIVSRPRFCSNVFEAALLTDQILGNPDETQSRGQIALAAAWMGALVRAGRISEGAPMRPHPPAHCVTQPEPVPDTTHGAVARRPAGL